MWYACVTLQKETPRETEKTESETISWLANYWILKELAAGKAKLQRNQQAGIKQANDSVQAQGHLLAGFLFSQGPVFLLLVPSPFWVMPISIVESHLYEKSVDESINLI